MPARALANLKHIQDNAFSRAAGGQPEHCCILLQEVNPESLYKVLKSELVRRQFCVTTADAWPTAHYGNVTLVPRSVPVLSTQLLRLENSGMGRHSIILDLRLDLPAASVSSGKTKSGKPGELSVTVRIAKVHLESLPVGAPARPI